MGWTGIPMAQRPNNQEMHRLADESIRSTRYSIVDRSGWQGWNHRYVLIELNPGVDPDLRQTALRGPRNKGSSREFRRPADSPYAGIP